MGRLTKKFDDGYGSTDCYHSCFDCYGNECESVTLMVDKLAHYEDMEEAGRLYVLACGIEKPLYVLIPQLDWKDSHFGTKWCISTVVPRDVEECLLWEDDVKRGMAFLTIAEAEAKLKELEGVKE